MRSADRRRGKLGSMWSILDRLGDDPFTPQERDALRAAVGVSSAGYDPWGFNLETAERTLRVIRYLYRDYFRTQVFHPERVPEGRVMVVANHGGQIPLDGMILATSMMLDIEPPRLVRGMVERWVPGLPWFSTLFTRCGQVVGDPGNCEELLRRDQSIMVFPEGAKGSGKDWWHRYQLQTFGTGFVRLALQTKTPIVPVGIIGSDDTYPSLYSSRRLGKLIGAPYLPITPLFPWFGPLGLIPLPVQIHVRFGDPLYFEGDPDESEAEVERKVAQVRASIQGLLDEGLSARPRLKQLDRWARLGR
ncbi:MAG: acyltransferase family protein [Deltaproteobacteria bacterium]|nr:MAG: acyltransferase family protein [Deltaproteobacteria bacterium]